MIFLLDRHGTVNDRREAQAHVAPRHFSSDLRREWATGRANPIKGAVMEQNKSPLGVAVAFRVLAFDSGISAGFLGNDIKPSGTISSKVPNR